MSHREAVQRATLVTWQDQVTAARDFASRFCVRKHKRQKRGEHSNNISHTLPGNQQEGGGAAEEWWRGISDRRRGEVGGTVVDHVSPHFLSFQFIRFHLLYCILVAFPVSACVPVVGLLPGSHTVCQKFPGAEGCSPKNWDCCSQVLRYEAVRVSTLLVMVTVGAWLVCSGFCWSYITKLPNFIEE